jgi:phospholipase C
MDTKRSLPKSPLAGACAASAVALAGFLPGSTATAQPVTPIQHVVVIYLENHSFDNVLGYWCDAKPKRCPDGGMPSQVTLSDGAVVTPSVDPDIVPNISHTVASQLAAMHIQGGVPQMDGWQNITGKTSGCGASTEYKCISGYTPAQVPNITRLAGRFAISDMTFSMADSPSWGGHLYAAMASTDNFTGDNPVAATGITPRSGWGCDSSRVTAWIGPNGRRHVVPSCIPDYSLNPVQYPNGGAFRPTPAPYHASIFDELDAARLPWRIYGRTGPDNAGGGGSNLSGGYAWSICPSLAECLDTGQKNNLVDNSQFFLDAKAGTLPAFSVITAGGTADGGILASCHNDYSMTACDNYIGKLESAVKNSPDWSSTAIFLTFDDFGGFYDQVPPPVNPDGTQEGPRTPLIIISPYAKRGHTDTTPATFAGILAYTEHNFGLSPLGPNDAGAYDFSNAFNYSQRPLKGLPMVTRPLPPSAKKIKLTPAMLDDPS